MSSWFDRRGDPECPHQCDNYGYEGRCQCWCGEGLRHVTEDGRDVYLCGGHRAMRGQMVRVHLAPWTHPDDPRTRVSFAGAA